MPRRDPERALALFALAVEADQAGDAIAARRYLRELRAAGWSVVPVIPRLDRQT